MEARACSVDSAHCSQTTHYVSTTAGLGVLVAGPWTLDIVYASLQLRNQYLLHPGIVFVMRPLRCSVSSCFSFCFVYRYSQFFWLGVLYQILKSHVPGRGQMVHHREAIGLPEPRALWGVHYFRQSTDRTMLPQRNLCMRQVCP